MEKKEGMKEKRKEGRRIREGKKGGAGQAHVEMAERLLAKGMTVEEVASQTGLSIEEGGSLQPAL